MEGTVGTGDLLTALLSTSQAGKEKADEQVGNEYVLDGIGFEL